MKENRFVDETCPFESSLEMTFLEKEISKHHANKIRLDSAVWFSIDNILK